MTTPPSYSDTHLDELAARLTRLETTVAAIDAGLTAGGGNGTPSPGGDNQPLLYPTLDAWVTGFLAVVFGRSIGGAFKWCPKWWDHGEALLRLESLWRSWEHLRLDPRTGMAVWLRDHFDHQWPRLTGESGPFASCTPTTHYTARPLPVDPMPAEIAQVWNEDPEAT